MSKLDQVIQRKIDQGKHPLYQAVALRMAEDKLRKETETQIQQVRQDLQKQAEKQIQEALRKGRTEGRTEGKTEGKTEGASEALRKSITNMLQRSQLTPEEIADILMVPLHTVRKIQKELKDNQAAE